MTGKSMNATEITREKSGKPGTAWKARSWFIHENKYFCFYSGGAWHTENYGLGFAVADHPLGPWKDEFASRGPTVLTGVADRVIGPGHNSVVIGPDGKTLFCIYHAWDTARVARRMCIDPIRWTKDGPQCDGPSYQSKPIES